MIYLDNAATSYPKPRSVLRAHAAALTRYGGNPGRGAHRLSMAAADMIYDCRCRVATLFGCDAPLRVVFTGGATAALNLAIRRRAYRGCHILLSDREHNATARPIYALCEGGEAEYEIYPTGENATEEIARRLRDNTAMVVACHTSNVTGYTQELAPIAALCQSRGIPLIIDAAQSAGHRKIDLAALPCDALCFPAHKGLLGAAGLGVAILADAEGAPLISGGGGTESLRRTMPSTLPERFEAGTLPTPAIAALHASVAYLEKRGIEEISARESDLRNYLLAGLSVIGGITVYEPWCDGGVISFTHSTHRPERLADLLDREGICVRAGYHCAPLAHQTAKTPEGGTVRISIGYSNTRREMEKLLVTLSRLVRES